MDFSQKIWNKIQELGFIRVELNLFPRSKQFIVKAKIFGNKKILEIWNLLSKNLE